MAETLLQYLSIGANHCWEPEAGPRKNPRYLAVSQTLKSAQVEICRDNHIRMLSEIEGERGIRGMSLHLIGFKVNPAKVLAKPKMGRSSRRCLRLRMATPRSSAQALMIPAPFPLRAVSKRVRNGSNAKLNKKAEAGHPCRTPDKK